jgi:hypothetical protein
VVRWSGGPVVLWFSNLVVRWSGGMVVWWSGSMVVWPKRIYNPITTMGFSAMFTFQLYNTKM